MLNFVLMISVLFVVLGTTPVRGRVVVPTCQSDQDCTSGIQAAIDDKTTTEVLLTSERSPWISQPLQLRRSHFKLTVEPGAILLARRWHFNSTGAMLLRVSDSRNLTISGGGSFKMWREDYNNTKFYNHSEDRMTLALYDVKDVLVEDITFEESGGDGIYVSNAANLTINRVISRNNYRQGMSVISAMRMRVFDSVFTGTAGTDPQSGVDFEPDTFTQNLNDIIFVGCNFTDNAGFGIQAGFHALNSSSTNVSITISRSVFAKNHRASFLASNPEGVGGYVKVEDFHAETTKSSYFLGGEDCRGSVFTFKNGAAVTAEGAATTAIDLRGATHSFVFENVTIVKGVSPSDFMTVGPTGRVFKCQDLRGRLSVKQPSGPCEYDVSTDRTPSCGINVDVNCINGTTIMP